MKKTFINAFIFAILFLIATTVVSADYEKIERAGVEIFEEITAVDTSVLLCETQPTYGNGIYVQVTRNVNGTDVGSLPEKYRNAQYSNSPIYVYDENLNHINSIEFDGVIPGFELIDGYFYFSQTIYGDDIYDKVNKYYKSYDMNEWIEMTYDEYMLIKRRVQLLNGMKYTWERYSYTLDDGSKVNTLKILEYLIDSGKIHRIEREDEEYVSAGNSEATDFSVCVTHRRSLEDYNDTSLITHYISLDGLSMFEIPRDANTNDIWNDDEYIYVGIRKDDVYCYRIPIEPMSDCVKVKYNDTYLSFAANPVIEDGRTLVPIRFLFEKMGAKVDWDNTIQTAIIEKDNDVISFAIDNTIAKVNNSDKIMDVPARLINGKTMIPLRFLSEELGFKVEWDEQTKTVLINE